MPYTAILVCSIVNRGDRLTGPANIKEANQVAKIYIERSTTLHNLLFCAHSPALCTSFVIKTFLLARSSVSSKRLLCFVHGQGQKSEQKRTTINCKLRKDGIFDDVQVVFHNILPSGSSPGDLFGVPKVHKTGLMPLPPQPIASSVNKHNRPFPSSLVSLFQNESKYETFHMKMSSACRSFLCKSKSFSLKRFRTQTRFEAEAQGNSEMACYNLASCLVGIQKPISTNQHTVKDSFSFADWAKSYKHANKLLRCLVFINRVDNVNWPP